MASAIVKQMAGLPPSPMHLKDLIKQVRLCKTHADESQIILTELSKIRNYFNDKRYKKYLYRNVIKLLYIHMLGYNITFGEMECINLISTSTNYFYKQIGYFGFSQLLNEKSDILMLVTNCLKIDLKSSNVQFMSLALTTLASVGSAEMCNDLAADVKHLFNYTDNVYLQKKAFAVAVRCVHKNNSLTDIFTDPLLSIYTNLTNSPLLSATELLIEIIRVNRAAVFPRYESIVFNYATKQVRSLLNNNSTEYDINGVNNPFLLIRLLRLLSVTPTTRADNKDVLNELIVEVSMKVDISTQINVAILHGLLELIIATHLNDTTINLAVNLATKILNMKNNNYKYVSLHFLFQLIKMSSSIELHKYESIILDSLNNENDMMIKSKLVEVLQILCDSSNVQTYTDKLFGLLTDETYIKSIQYNTPLSVQHRKQLTTALYSMCHKFSDMTDTVINVIKLAESTASILPDAYVNNVINTVTHADNEVQVFATCHVLHRIHTALSNLQRIKPELIQISAWLTGEYGQHIAQASTAQSMQYLYNQHKLDDFDVAVLSESTVLDVYDKLVRSHSTNITTNTKLYILTSYAKLSTRFDESLSSRVVSTLQHFVRHKDAEVQARAIEYVQLLSQSFSAQIRSEALSQMPLFEAKQQSEMVDGEEVYDEVEDEKVDVVDAKPTKAVEIDLLDLFGSDLTETTVQPTPTPTSVPAKAQTPPKQVNGTHKVSPQAKQSKEIDLLDAFADIGVDEPAAEKQPDYPMKSIYEKNGLTIRFRMIEQSDNNVTVDAVFSNSTANELTEFDYQIAVLKYIELQLLAADSSTIPAHSNDKVTQRFTLSKQVSEKKFVMRCRVSYAVNGENVEDMFQFSDF